MDLARAAEPRSDQTNADDLIAGPMTVTIEQVHEGSSEQPVVIDLVERPGRPYKPNKSMIRVLIGAWGRDTKPYAGRRMTIYRDPEVSFGRDKVGGIKISHLSHIEKRQAFNLTITRGKRAPHVVEPLPDAPAPSPTLSADQIAASTDVGWLREQWPSAGPEQRERIKARVQELTQTTEGTER